MKKLIFTACFLSLSAILWGESDSDIKQKIIQSSLSSYRGNCPCPYNTDRAGRRCGRRSAYSRPGGYTPICYESDVTAQMVESYKQAHPTRNIITGKVVKVADGDTLTVLNSQNQQIKIRLYGIDAPEKAQDFGTVSKDYLASLVAGQTINVTVIDIDQYGRNVGRIQVDGKEVAEEMLKSGLAWLYTAYCKIPQCNQWKSLETQAKATKIGLWANPTAQEPWLWRKTNK
ncbi:MAG: thermonuclease family protein [Elusimicrobiaceae bacterium]|nr:thermonuclease family protein [Elusimicrobiaceae bacterium]